MAETDTAGSKRNREHAVPELGRSGALVLSGDPGPRLATTPPLALSGQATPMPPGGHQLAQAGTCTGCQTQQKKRLFPNVSVTQVLEGPSVGEAWTRHPKPS